MTLRDSKFGCRIARVRPKGGGAEIAILQPVPSSSQLVEALVEVLASARRGKIRSFALTFEEATDEDGHTWHRAWAVDSPDDFYHDCISLVGSLQMMVNRVQAKMEES